MNYLFAALDESSDGYCALVVGDKSAIDQNLKAIPLTFVHMTSWHGGDDEKRIIIQNLKLEGKILVHCAKFGLKKLDEEIGEAILSGKCRMPQTKRNNIIGYEIARFIDKSFGSFAQANRFPVRNLNFEVDNSEIIPVIKSGHDAFLKYGRHRDAHTIADCIAYANFRRWDISPKVVEHGPDFEDEFHSNVLKSIKKN